MSDCDAHELGVLHWDGDVLVLKCLLCDMEARVHEYDISWAHPDWEKRWHTLKDKLNLAKKRNVQNMDIAIKSMEIIEEEQ